MKKCGENDGQLILLDILELIHLYILDHSLLLPPNVLLSHSPMIILDMAICTSFMGNQNH